MLRLDQALPEGALCSADPAAIMPDLGSCLWWHGAADAFETAADSGAITCWQEALGGPPAHPTRPNQGNGLIGAIDAMTGLQCRAGMHCGMVAEGVVQAARTVTLAIRYYCPPGGDPLTLLTLNATSRDPANYLFLSEADGVLTVKDDSDLIELSLPVTADDRARLAIVSLKDDALAVALDGTQTHGHAPTAVLDGSADLFIGARSHRSGLLKTLGAALILDIWLFPGRALLQDRDEAGALRALSRHHIWAEG